MSWTNFLGQFTLLWRWLLSEMEQLTKVVSNLKQAMGDNLVSIVLYGSQARNEAREDSDWDLLIIAHSLPKQTLKRHFWLKGLLPHKWRGLVSILAKTPTEFEARLPSLWLDIAVDGIVLHDSDDYMTTKLAELNRLLEKQGLHRQRYNHDFIWQWNYFPGVNWSLEWETV
jgi:predicted nucleotidyltransferase